MCAIPLLLYLVVCPLQEPEQDLDLSSAHSYITASKPSGRVLAWPKCCSYLGKLWMVIQMFPTTLMGKARVRKQVQALDSGSEDSHWHPSVYMSSSSLPGLLCKDLETRISVFTLHVSLQMPPSSCPLVCLTREQVGAWVVAHSRWCIYSFSQVQGVKQGSIAHLRESELQVYSFQKFRKSKAHCSIFR